MAIDYKPEQNDYTNLTPFKTWLVTQINTWGVNNFPFLEGDFDKLTNYGMLMKMMKCLNDIISNQNLVEDDMSKMYNAFTELQTYINDYFDNLDVQEEINNKLDEMAENGELSQLIETYINPYLTNFNTRLDEQDTKIDSLASGSPLVASSTSEMTDTTRVYVNTTDGNWYYYNGTNWVIGGVYQASEDSQTVNLLSKYNPKMIKNIQNNNIIMTKDENNFTVSLELERAIYIFTENRWLNMQYVQPAVFSLTDYNINTGAWALIIRNNTFNLIQLQSNINSMNQEINDLIVGIIRPTDFITLIPDRITFNGIELGLAHKYHNYHKDCYLNNRLDINIDSTNKTITISNLNNRVLSIYGGRYFTNIDALASNTINYENYLNTTYGNVLSILFNKQKNEFEFGQVPNIQTIRGNYLNNLFKNSFYEVLIATFNIVTRELVPFVKNNLYVNNELVSSDKLNNEITNLNNKVNLLDIVNKYDFLRCFKNFTFIGDSLTAGYTSVDGHIIDSATAKAQNNNWPSYLCSRLNREFTNLGFGSSTIHNWRYGDQVGQDTNINLANITTGIYFVGLGVNDLRGGLTVGTSADINTSDYTQNVDSVYGNYDFIINKLKSFNPYAKIFVFTIPNSENNPQDINNAIKYVANLYDNVYCIDLNTLYDFSTGFIADNFTNGHYNPITYNYMSLLIEKATNDYIFNNSTEFDLVPYSFN